MPGVLSMSHPPWRIGQDNITRPRKRPVRVHRRVSVDKGVMFYIDILQLGFNNVQWALWNAGISDEYAMIVCAWKKRTSAPFRNWIYNSSYINMLNIMKIRTRYFFNVWQGNKSIEYFEHLILHPRKRHESKRGYAEKKHAYPVST